MFCRIVVAMCHIFPITCSSWVSVPEILSHIQAHILFLLLVSDGALQPESKGRSHKHNVRKTQTQNLCQEHFLLNHIRLNVIWNNSCKTMKECTPMIPDYILLCCWFFRFDFFSLPLGMFIRWIPRSAALLPTVHTAALYCALYYLQCLLTCPDFIHSGKDGRRLK